MGTQYEKIRAYMKTNPAVSPQMREFATALDASITWPATSTTTTTVTTTTAATTTTALP